MCAHQCHLGYLGGSITCQADGTYAVVGCTADTNTCQANEPDTTSSNMQAIVADSCDATPTDATCAHTCATRYDGGSITCQGDATYVVVGCTAIVCAAIDAAATCTGADDGAGTNTACALNADNSACAVAGADCAYTAANAAPAGYIIEMTSPYVHKHAHIGISISSTVSGSLMLVVSGHPSLTLALALP